MPSIDDPLSLLHNDPESPITVLLQRARLSLSAGDHCKAMQQCQLALDKCDDNPARALALAHMACVQGLSEPKAGDDTAKAAIQHLCDLDQEHNEAITCLIRAFVHYRSRDWDKACTAYDTSRERLRTLCNRALTSKDEVQAREYDALVVQIGRRLEEIAQVIAEKLTMTTEQQATTTERHAANAEQHAAAPPDRLSSDSLFFLPVIGSIPAGQARISTDDIQENVLTAVDQVSIDGEKYRFKRIHGEGSLIRLNHRQYEYYLSRVTGDSMDQAEIDEGDYVVLRQPAGGSRVRPDSYDIVVASVSDSDTDTDLDTEVTLKRYIRRGNTVILRPESSSPRHKFHEFHEGHPGLTIVAVAIAVLKPAK